MAQSVSGQLSRLSLSIKAISQYQGYETVSRLSLSRFPDRSGAMDMAQSVSSDLICMAYSYQQVYETG